MTTVDCTNYDQLKEELTELGLYELGMNMKDMTDLMEVIKNSQDSAKQEEQLRETKQIEITSGDTSNKDEKNGMHRKYKNAPERRLPWNLFPYPEQLTLEQRVSVMAAYKEQQSICRYRRAKTSSVFAEWNCVFSIPISKHRASPEYKSNSILHTRSGRTLKAAPHYVDDDSDSESYSVSRKCRKKPRKMTSDEIIAKSSLFRDSQPQSQVEPSNETAKKQNEPKGPYKIMLNLFNRTVTSEDDGKHMKSPTSVMNESGSAPALPLKESPTSESGELLQVIDSEEISESSRLSRKRPKRLKMDGAD